MSGLSRRQFVVGLAAVGAAGAMGTQTSTGRRALRAVGVLDSVDRAVPEADVRVGRGALPGGRRYRWARTGNRDDGPALAIACLHGRNVDEGFAFDTIGVHRFAAAAGLDVVVASLDGGAAGYWHKRRSGEDAMAALIDELAPMLDAKSGGAPKAVLGWSMGGYGALLAAEEHPGVFGAVAATSPAVWRRAQDTSKGAFDSAADFTAHDVLGGIGRLGAGVRVRVDCGNDDPFATTSRELLRLVPGAVGGLRPGAHDAGFWRTLVPEQLRFLTSTS
jgi:S-formylglutathione hydrolase FrmB